MKRILSFFGSLKSSNTKLNDEIDAAALRNAALEQTLASVRSDLARAIQGNAAWAAKFADLQDKLDEARNTIGVSDAQYEGAQAALKAARSEIEELEANEETNWPLISYALRQKANRAKYDAKRRGK